VDYSNADVDLNAALKWLDAAVVNKTGHSLREPELVILKGTWRGFTYEQMTAGSEYSTNYLMRDVAPKLWKQLSSVFGRSVGKTNFRVALEAYATTHARDIERAVSTHSSQTRSINPQFNRPSSPKEEAYWHPSILPELSMSAQLPLRSTESIHCPSKPAMSAAALCGYKEQLAQINQWIKETFDSVDSRQPRTAAPAAHRTASGGILGIWGLTGIGKTHLAEKTVAQVSDRFEGVIWRSLRTQPSLNELSTEILASLGIRNTYLASTQLLTLMAQRSLLIVLENVEAILQADQLAGSYAPDCLAYKDFFQSVVGSRSCILLTGIEGPTEFTRSSTPNNQTGICSLTLKRLSETAAHQLLKAELSEAALPTETALVTKETGANSIGFPQDFSILAGAIVELPHDASSHSAGPSSPSADDWPELIARYQGHPLALKSACRIITEIFNGQVDEFLKQTPVLFTDILRLLAPSFDRITLSERHTLDWLAGQNVARSLPELSATLPPYIDPTELVSILDSLRQRSLLEIDSDGISPKFYLSPLTQAYTVHQFVCRFTDQTTASTTAPLFQQATQLIPSPVATEQTINLSSSPTSPIQLSQWAAGHTHPAWQPLGHLFKSSACPTSRLRSTYHLQDEAVIKRYKSLTIGITIEESAEERDSPSSTPKPINAAATNTTATNTTAIHQIPSSKIVLVVAIHPSTESVYKLCIQAQPLKEDTALPPNLTLKLLDTQQTALATVVAKQSDPFIQLPYFQGAISECFSIELSLEDSTHIEAFMI